MPPLVALSLFLVLFDVLENACELCVDLEEHAEGLHRPRQLQGRVPLFAEVIHAGQT